MIEVDDVRIEVPQNHTTKWVDAINTAFGGRFVLELATETWWTDPQRGRASAYLEPNDRMGATGWRHDLSGIFDGIIYTNLPEASHVKGDGYMIGLREARLGNNEGEIDPGHIVLVGLHDVIGALRFRTVAELQA